MDEDKVELTERDLAPFAERTPTHLAASAIQVAHDFFIGAMTQDEAEEEFWEVIFKDLWQKESLDVDELRDDLFREEGSEEYAMLIVVVIAVACAVNAMKADLDKNQQLAWAYASDAMWWSGMLYIWMNRDEESSNDLSGAMRVLAKRRHAENHSMRDQAVQWYLENKSTIGTKDAAAEAIAGKVVPAKFRTVRDWLTKVK